jgi:dTDP-4-dehydrorhamnose 3,5-epimerase
LVRVVYGSVLDVAVDLRESSSTFGRYAAVELSGDNKRQLFIPRGFAHCFVVTSDEAVLFIRPNTKEVLFIITHTIGINWGMDASRIQFSPKDLDGKLFIHADYF